MNLNLFILEHWREILTLTREHLALVFISTFIAVAIGIPLGILLTRIAWLKRPVLAVAGILQTVPSLALFGFLIPITFIGGIGARTAIIALVLYALLPIIRNTVTGIETVDRNVREAAQAVGMTDRQILFQVELPLASSVILAGVRVATVISVGVATIAAAIGAGGLGTYIFRGLRMNDDNLILAGAIPAALMALCADAILGLIESRVNILIGKERAAAKTERAQVWRRRAALIGVALLILVGILSATRFTKFSNSNQNSARETSTQKRDYFIIGSKDFTESIILAEILAQELEARGVQIERRFELGGNLCHDALISGQIDAYPEYTGTSFTAILKHQPLTDPQAVYEQVKHEYAERFDVEVSAPLGFSNDFAILVRGAEARRLGLKRISDIAPLAKNWRAGFGQDFVSRPDGYAGFIKTYNLQFARVREMDLSLTYRALAAGEVDIIAGNSTDGLIAALDLTQLEDDRRYFPPYQAVYLVRRDALSRFPAASDALTHLANSISTDEMRRLNYEVDGKHLSTTEAAREAIKK